MNPYVYLAGAIVLEVIATSLLKASEGMTRLGPTLGALAGYGVCFYLLSLTMKSIPPASPMRSGPASASC